MTSYERYIAGKRLQYGERFNPSALDQRFVPYFNSDERIKVDDPAWGEVTGTVGVTTGWKPCFLLMRRSNSIGSSITLSERTKILAVKHGRKYMEVSA